MGETDRDGRRETGDGRRAGRATYALWTWDGNPHAYARDPRARPPRRPHWAYTSHTPRMPRESLVWKEFAAKITQPKHVLVETRCPAARRELSCVANIFERQCVSERGTNGTVRERSASFIWEQRGADHKRGRPLAQPGPGPSGFLPFRIFRIDSVLGTTFIRLYRCLSVGFVGIRGFIAGTLDEHTLNTLLVAS